MKTQMTKIRQNNFEIEEEQAGQHFDFKIYHKITATEPLVKVTIIPRMYGQLIFNEDANEIQRRNRSPFSKYCSNNWMSM